ncbi:hypothetical protein D1007_60149 [Hordeum vulgare]|nr:hypothetical protein D1007_60149 [Hordeum vulgare]
MPLVGSGDSRERGEITIAVREGFALRTTAAFLLSLLFILSYNELLKLLEPTDVSMMSEEAFLFVTINSLSLEVAGARLNKARLGFELSHGTDSTRFRLLQARFKQGLA